MSDIPVVVFACEHGAAKSIVAAAHFNKLAQDRVEDWSDVPPVSGGYATSRDAILERIRRLLETLP